MQLSVSDFKTEYRTRRTATYDFPQLHHNRPYQRTRLLTKALCSAGQFSFIRCLTKHWTKCHAFLYHYIPSCIVLIPWPLFAQDLTRHVDNCHLHSLSIYTWCLGSHSSCHYDNEAVRLLLYFTPLIPSKTFLFLSHHKDNLLEDHHRSSTS